MFQVIGPFLVWKAWVVFSIECPSPETIGL